MKNGLSGTFYVDGQPAGTITATRDIHYDSNIIIIGEQSGPFPFAKSFQGQMTSVYVYNASLSASQVQRISTGFGRSFFQNGNYLSSEPSARPPLVTLTLDCL